MRSEIIKFKDLPNYKFEKTGEGCDVQNRKYRVMEAVQTLGKFERFVLVIKNFTILIFSFFLAFMIPSVRNNLKEAYFGQRKVTFKVLDSTFPESEDPKKLSDAKDPMTPTNEVFEIGIEILKIYGSLLKDASEKVKSDFESVLAAVMQDGLALEYACAELRNNEKIVRVAVKQNGLALEYASEDLKGVLDIAMDAIESRKLAFYFVSEKLYTNSAFMKKAIQIQAIPQEKLNDKEFVLKVSKAIPEIFDILPQKLRDDPEFIKELLKDYRFKNWWDDSRQAPLEDDLMANEPKRDDEPSDLEILSEGDSLKMEVLKQIKDPQNLLGFALNNNNLSKDKEIFLNVIGQNGDLLNRINDSIKLKQTLINRNEHHVNRQARG